MYVTEAVFVNVADGALIPRVGAVLSTLKTVLGPADPTALPATSVAVAAAIEIPNVPSPVMPEIVTVRVATSDPDTATVPLAVPVVFNVMLPVVSVIALTPLPLASA